MVKNVKVWRPNDFKIQAMVKNERIHVTIAALRVARSHSLMDIDIRPGESATNSGIAQATSVGPG
jgi:hypothetical protein